MSLTAEGVMTKSFRLVITTIALTVLFSWFFLQRDNDFDMQAYCADCEDGALSGQEQLVKVDLTGNIASREISPNGEQEIINYKFKQLKESTGDFPETNIFVLVNASSLDKRVVYSSDDRVGYPHWLDDRHFYFTRHCGTSCTGYGLFNTETEKLLEMTVSYMYSENGSYTTFTDWFGELKKFDGLGGDMRTEIIDQNPYLIFDLTDGDGNSIGEKRFLFTGSSLENV